MCVHISEEGRENGMRVRKSYRAKDEEKVRSEDSGERNWIIYLIYLHFYLDIFKMCNSFSSTFYFFVTLSQSDSFGFFSEILLCCCRLIGF